MGSKSLRITKRNVSKIITKVAIVTYRLEWYWEWWDLWYGLTNWKGLLIGAFFSIPFFCRIALRDPVFLKEELIWEYTAAELEFDRMEMV